MLQRAAGQLRDMGERRKRLPRFIQGEVTIYAQPQHAKPDWPMLLQPNADAPAFCLGIVSLAGEPEIALFVNSEWLEQMRAVGLRRPIVVGTVDFELHDVPWLRPRATSCRALTLYDSRPGLQNLARRSDHDVQL